MKYRFSTNMVRLSFLLGVFVASIAPVAQAQDILVAPIDAQWNLGLDPDGSQGAPSNVFEGAGLVDADGNEFLNEMDEQINPYPTGTTVPASFFSHQVALASNDGSVAPEDVIAINSIGFRTSIEDQLPLVLFDGTEIQGSTVHVQLDRSYDLTGLVLWNFAANFNGAYTNERGFTEFDLHTSNDGGTNFTYFETMTFQLSPQQLPTIDAQQQAFTNGTVTADALRFDLPDWDGNFRGFLEMRLTAEPLPFQPGDFDADGDVDGADFLGWQRDTNVGTLADWTANYGFPNAATVSFAAVPEPSTAFLAIVVCAVGPAARRRKLN